MSISVLPRSGLLEQSHALEIEPAEAFWALLVLWFANCLFAFLYASWFDSVMWPLDSQNETRYIH